jgi:hypothetical protein
MTNSKDPAFFITWQVILDLLAPTLPSPRDYLLHSINGALRGLEKAERKQMQVEEVGPIK